MKRRPVVRRERWLSLVEVADLLKLTQPNRAARRRAALRIVRMAEHLNETKLTKRFGNKVYVSNVMVETLFPLSEDRVFNVESSLAELSQKHRALDRKVTNHGARIGKCERQQALAQDYLKGLAQLE
jgi:hypothetical protein